MVDPLKSSNAPAQVGKGENAMSDSMSIQGLGAARALQSVTPQRQVVPQASGQPENAANDFDTVEISFMAEMLNRLHSLPDIRRDKVAAVRQAIMNGTYDIQGKLDVAIERMIEDIQ